MQLGDWEGTVDASENPVNSPVEAQVVYPIIYKVLYIPNGGFLRWISEPSTVTGI